MENNNETKELILNNEYDYSNIVATAENIGYLVNYCEVVYKQLIYLFKEEEIKNEKLKSEFKNYLYKKSYNDRFEVTIRDRNFKSFVCKSYESYVDALKNKQVYNIESLDIELELGYKRGGEYGGETYENKFKISFKPYKIIFTRNSNHNEENMNIVETNINIILKKFEVANTIFCTK